VPIIPIESYFASLEEHVSPACVPSPQEAPGRAAFYAVGAGNCRVSRHIQGARHHNPDLQPQVVSTTSLHNSIPSDCCCSIAWRWRGFRGVKQKCISYAEMLGVWEEQGSAGTCMVIHACLLTTGSISRQRKAPLVAENHKRSHSKFRMRMSAPLLQACLAKLRLFKDQIEPLVHDILVIYNPFSGSGSARAAFPKVCGVFAAAGARLQILETRAAQHAFDIIYSVENLRMQLIVIIGGDGTICEVASALLHRPAAKRVPIAVIAGGTECAVASAVSFKHPVTAAYHILKAHIMRPLDAMCVILTRPYGLLASKKEEPKQLPSNTGGIFGGLRKSFDSFFGDKQPAATVSEAGSRHVSSSDSHSAPATASTMAAPTIAAAAAAAAADAESSSSSGEGSESDGTSDGESIVAHPGASSSDFESSMLQVPIVLIQRRRPRLTSLRSCGKCREI